MDRPDSPHYREEQRLRQWWVWAIVLPVAGIAWWSFLVQVVGGKPWGDQPAPDWVVWILFGIIGVLSPVALYLARLVVTVGDEVIRLRWIPFARKTVRLADVASVEARTYRPIREYGGWGIKWGGKRGTAWNASGNRGVQLVLSNGKRLLIGSQRADELARAIEKARASS